MAAIKQLRVPVPDTQASDCNICGSEATHGRPVFVARLVDVDGSFHQRLCGSCFDDVEREIANIELEREAALIAGATQVPTDFGAARREAARVLADVGILDDDDDGFQGMVEDHGDQFFGDVA